MNLTQHLADYDGKTVAILEEIAAHYEGAGVSLRKSKGALAEAIRLAGAPDENAAIGATWLMRRWLVAGTSAGPDLVHELATSLKFIPSHWARLHVCQSIGVLEIPAADAATFATFLGHCRASNHPFLRAWATDGMVRLAAQHDAYAAEARTALEAALSDRAPSVRARARRITMET